MVRQRCREIESKLRHIENVLGFLDAMSEIDGTKTPSIIEEKKSEIDLIQNNELE